MISYFTDPGLDEAILTFQHRRQAGEAVRFYLAEGDSWFSIGGATSNLLIALDDPDTLIVSCAYPGDTLRNMAQMGNEPFLMLLTPWYGAIWDGVLLSAGGNDVLGNISRLVNRDGLILNRVVSLLDDIEAGYLRLTRSVAIEQRCPVYAHTYDYPVSDPHGGFWRLGPWVGDKLLAAGIDVDRHDEIISDLIDLMASRLYRIPGLKVQETRGILQRHRWGMIGGQKHWRNEIHPSKSGYDLLAEKWEI
jgi:lysophospholipase L1-like esterase